MARPTDTQSDHRPMASLSLDLDNLWTYLKIHGDEWESRPSYLDTFTPYMLEALDQLGVSITFFIVGADADRDENAQALRSIVDAGHEIGNHSYEHEPWLQLYSDEQLEEEIDRAHDAIKKATGVAPVGFRGPGFSWSPNLLRILADRNYQFDASTLPTFLGPLARMYYFWSSDLDAEEKEKRKELFGKFRDGFRSIKPYFWRVDNGKRLLEIPVTTMPVFKTPFHLSYLAYLARFSRGLMKAYLRTAMFACKLTNTEPSFLLHPLDVIGGDQVPELEFFPGMDIPSDEKKELFFEVLNTIAESFEIVPMGIHAQRILERSRLVEKVAA